MAHPDSDPITLHANAPVHRREHQPDLATNARAAAPTAGWPLPSGIPRARRTGSSLRRHDLGGNPALGGVAARLLLPEPPPPRVLAVVAGGAVAAAFGAFLFTRYGVRTGVPFVVALLLGVVLFHARFGFTSAWRQLVTVGQGQALRAQTLMLAVGSLLFAPILASGTGLFGLHPHGYVFPVGVSLVVGAFLFGLGMQLAGSCASGTLYAAGAGQGTTLLALAGFVAGSLLGTWHWAFWVRQMPAGPAVDLARSLLGYPGALALQLALLALVAYATLRLERRRQPPPIEPPPVAAGVARVVRGSWPLWVGALGLAALNAVTLVTTGLPWGITSAFALWGAKLAQPFGVPVADWAYWQVPANAAALHGPLLANVTSNMDIGIVVGALVAAALSGTFTPWRLPGPRVALAALLGGALMGYGARLAFGCNIGSYFSGIVSFSLHGWVWGAMALAGTYLGVRLRPLFGLVNPKPRDAVC